MKLLIHLLVCHLLFCLNLLTAQIRRVDPHTAPGSGMPFLTTGTDGAVFLSWIDPLAPKEHALRFSRWTGTAWSNPETIAQGRNWFVNWGDFPSLAALPDGSMLAHWLTRTEGAGTYGYGIRVARRDPATASWREIYGISLDEKIDYAGFLTFAHAAPAAVYLAPPSKSAAAHHSAGAEHVHRKTLRFVAFSPSGTHATAVETDREIDADVCSCCQTAIGKTRSGWIVAYRDHLPGEIRDISILRYTDGAWASPVPLHRDGWKINGCPTDGPSLISNPDRIAIAWLTRAGDQPRIQVASSTDEGRTFSPPLRLDSGNPLGRPAITAYDRHSDLIVWLEKTAAAVEIRLRRIGHDGTLHPPVTVAQAPPGRGSGFPKVAVSGDWIFLAWRDEVVRAAILTKTQLLQKEQE